MGRDCDLRKWIDQGVCRFKDIVSGCNELEEHLRKRNVRARWWGMKCVEDQQKGFICTQVPSTLRGGAWRRRGVSSLEWIGRLGEQ